VDLITVTRKTGSEFAICVRAHEVTSDMSAKYGGCDRGPSPIELFAGSLGACIAMTVNRYCQSHGYTNGSVGVSLTLQMADDPIRVKSIVVDLEIPKDVPEDRREAIRRVAEHCPIHATLKNPPDVDLDIVLAED
jgi:putative redox protein